MKSVVGGLIGRTVSGVIVAESEKRPRQQVFLTFTDGTYFEFWGDQFSCAGGLQRGGISEVTAYVENTMGAKVSQMHRPPEYHQPLPSKQWIDPDPDAEGRKKLANLTKGAQLFFWINSVGAVVTAFWTLFMVYDHNGFSLAILALFGLAIALKFGEAVLFMISATVLCFHYQAAGQWVAWISYAVGGISLILALKIAQAMRGLPTQLRD